jgi:serine/threonine protein kinase
MDETFITEKQFNSHYIFSLTENKLGHGSYGDVYIGKNEDNKKIAIKICPYDNKEGIPHLLEASIMQTLLHPCLNHAIKIVCTEAKLYIIQELAVMDLHTYTHYSKMNHQWTKPELIQVYHSLFQAVSILHYNNLIHCDIKSNNILIYANGQIKLTDFTLTTTHISQLTHTVCTPTHRPIECHLNDIWNEKLDLWSLGCTLYEITYHCFLFPKQNHVNKYINAILDWGQTQDQLLPQSFYTTTYEKVKCCKVWYEDQFNINHIIKSLLQVTAINRINTFDLLKDDLFKNLVCCHHEMITIVPKVLCISEQARVMRYIEQCTNHTAVQKKAYDIYCTIHDLLLTEFEKAVGVSWIASKLLLDTTVLVNKLIPLDKILQIEKDICHHLQFRLSMVNV